MVAHPRSARGSALFEILPDGLTATCNIAGCHNRDKGRVLDNLHKQLYTPAPAGINLFRPQFIVHYSQGMRWTQMSQEA